MVLGMHYAVDTMLVSNMSGFLLTFPPPNVDLVLTARIRSTERTSNTRFPLKIVSLACASYLASPSIPSHLTPTSIVRGTHTLSPQ